MIEWEIVWTHKKSIDVLDFVWGMSFGMTIALGVVLMAVST